MSTINLSRIVSDNETSIISPVLKFVPLNLTPILSATSSSIDVTNTDINLNQRNITGSAAPSSPTDLTNKQYVDNLIQGLSLHQSCRLASISNVDLTSKSGDSVDGVVLNAGDRLLLKDQVNTIENGIYDVASTSPLSRSSDMSSGSNCSTVFVYVTEGAINTDSQWACNNTRGQDIVDTDSVQFILFASATNLIAGQGLSKTSNALDVNVDEQSIEIVNDTLRLKSTVASTGLSGGSGAPLSVNAYLAHVTGLGTIGSGTWQGSVVSVPFGGSGNTSFVSGGIITGNGTGPLNVSDNCTFDGSNFNLNGDLLVNHVPITPNGGDIVKQQTFSWTTPGNNLVITGLQFQSTIVRSFIAHVSVSANGLFELWTLRGVNSSGGWTLITESVGDTVNISFDINSNGQIIYTTVNTTGSMNFRAIVFSS